MTDQETTTILRAERARHPELADTLDLHIAILEARAKIVPTKVPYIEAAARARFERGEPLLRADELGIDWSIFVRLFQTVCHIAARYQRDHAAAFAELATLFESGNPRAEETVREFLAETPHVLPGTPPASLDTRRSSLLAFALNNALHPFLAAYARAGASLVDDAAWYRGHCPICGGAPDFAALQKESGARRLLCSRCDFEWTFHRAKCPFCGEDAPGKLGYYPGKDSVYRLYTCENCKRYLKTIDLRELARAANLPAERVLTVAMDAAAHEAGYR